MSGVAEISLSEYIRSNQIEPVRLHLGCGGVRWPGFINVDMNPHDESRSDSSRNGCVAEVFADMRCLNLGDASVEEIFTSHTVDHFTRWQAMDMFADWYRMIKPGGKVAMELADFNRCVLWLFHPSRRKRELARNQFYGNQWDRIDYETHRYVWSAGELKKALKEIGFSRVTISHATQTHHPGRDMRIEATK
ncbi:class I SAM-dependent methyltransferase [Tautonia marina]|uniref:class I SAM-dependent methyltransferase n=1 Tax=Tautonia marina TaxID=2653855 RepID=UPI001260D9C1|nr:methyltransferase domain-containing protein [Tautonia marina]